MKIYVYYARYKELNQYLTQFPPFGTNQVILNDKIKEHAEFAIPQTWQEQMVQKDYGRIY